MKKAQSVLEYVIVLTVIIGAIIAASGYLRGQMQTGMNTASDSIANSLSGNPSINTLPPVVTPPVVTPPVVIPPVVTPPGPTTPVPRGTLPLTDIASLQGDVTIWLPNSIPNPTPAQIRDLRSVGINSVGGWGTGSTIMERSSTGYLSPAQRAKINELWP